MEQKTLQVGDRVYGTRYSHICAIHKIVSVTDKTAVSDKGQAFNLKYVNIIDTPTREKFKTVYYFIETPELKTQLARQNGLHEIKNCDFEKLTDEQIAAIRAILKNK